MPQKVSDARNAVETRTANTDIVQQQKGSKSCGIIRRNWIWVLIPLAAIVIAPFKMWLRVKEKQIRSQSNLAAEKSAQYAQHMERVEARLRVLEQIVTDRRRQTAAQIEALRDQARIPSGDQAQ